MFWSELEVPGTPTRMAGAQRMPNTYAGTRHSHIQCQVSTQSHMTGLIVQKVKNEDTIIKSELCFTTSFVVTNN